MSSRHETYIIGVDGGGSGCRVAISDTQGHILARAEGGAANVSTDFAASIRNILAAMETAVQQIEITLDDLGASAVHLGLAGVISDEISDRVAAALPFQNICVTDDRPTALAGALAGRDGSLLAIGTGVIVATRNGTMLQCASGWGLQVSDHGGGAWLGRRLLEEVLFCCDGLREHTALTRKISDDFSGDPAQIASFSLTASPGDFGQFARDIVSFASQADNVGQMLLKSGAAYLQDNLQATGFRAGDQLCLSGGLGPVYAAYLADEFTQNLIAPEGDALAGALQLAAGLLAERDG